MGVGPVANRKAECPEMSNQTLKLVQNSKQEHTKKSVQRKATKPTIYNVKHHLWLRQQIYDSS